MTWPPVSFIPCRRAPGRYYPLHRAKTVIRVTLQPLWTAMYLTFSSNGRGVVTQLTPARGVEWAELREEGPVRDAPLEGDA